MVRVPTRSRLQRYLQEGGTVDPPKASIVTPASSIFKGTSGTGSPLFGCEGPADLLEEDLLVGDEPVKDGGGSGGSRNRLSSSIG